MEHPWILLGVLVLTLIAYRINVHRRRKAREAEEEVLSRSVERRRAQIREDLAIERNMRTDRRDDK